MTQAAIRNYFEYRRMAARLAEQRARRAARIEVAETCFAAERMVSRVRRWDRQA